MSEIEDVVDIQMVQPMDMLSLSVLVLFLGMYLNRRIRFLSQNYIPPAVTGGLLFSALTAGLYFQFDVALEFDMQFRDLLLLVFFSTVGLSARMKALAGSGGPLLVLVLAAGVFLTLQNSLGVAIALLSDVHPAYGLIAGSVSFAGGHGTAIAWGAAAEDAGLQGATEIGMAFATFGLVAGGLVGGPIARRLIAKHGVEPPDDAMVEERSSEAHASASAGEESPMDWLYPVLMTLLVLALCVSLGDIVNRYLSEHSIRMPGFLTAMFVGILVTNLADGIGRPLERSTIDRFGEVSLHVFLAMSMMTIQLWTLTNAASAILVVLVTQILLMTIFAEFIVFRLMGRDYDAVVIAAGFAGMGLGATPVAIANMDAVTQRYGPSTKALLVVPLVGALFIDLLNAGTINFFIRLIRMHLV